MKALRPIAACFAITLTLGAAEIRNPGFEQGRKSFEGVGDWWFSTEDSCDFDTEIFHSGKRAIRLSVNDSTSQKASQHWSRYAYLTGRVKDVRPDTIYTIRCFVRTDMTAGQAGIAVCLLKEKMTMPDRIPVKFLPVRKSVDWTELVYSFKTGKDTTGIALYCAVENFTGSAWFDDFSIREGIDIPAVPESSDWDQALVLNEFILIGDAALERKQPEAQTEIRLLSCGDKLMIRGICFEPDMKNLKASVSGRDRGEVCKDDCVELFLDAQRSRSSYYHFIFNANGALYDASGKDSSWSPADIQLTTAKEADRWTFELILPYTALGYGQVEAALPDKQMALSVFRSRKTVSPSEVSGWQPWFQRSNFHAPMLFQPILAGSGTKGEQVNFMYRGQMGNFMRLPLAWKVPDPLYEELMTEEPMFPETGSILNIGFRGSDITPKETAFALQHGMKKHYAETCAIKNEMRSVYNMITLHREDRATWDRIRKYDQRIGLMPMVQWGGAYYGYDFRSDAPKFKFYSGAYFYPDPRVREGFEKHVLALFESTKDVVDEITLGHEGRYLYFARYDQVRETYMKNDPAAWKAMEDQAKKEFGHGTIGFPESYEAATPLERMVYQRFVFSEYNKGIRKLASELRKIKPGIRLISELDPDGMKPYFYEQIPGTYDFICQQMLWGNGANRQSVAFNCKFLGDIAETPVRGGPHIEHYFVSLNPEETNEVISSVFRVGGESLQLWLNDWFGNTLGDYYGAPERFHEIRSLCKYIAAMRKLKFPEPDSAILYSNINQTASWVKVGGIGGGYEEAFTVLGPRARSWFKFVSDTQMMLGHTDCARFKVLYDPGSPYFEDDAYRKLVEYVENGGTLVTADPRSYSLRTDGSARDTSKLLGVTIGETSASPAAGAIKLRENPQFPELSKIADAAVLPSSGAASLIPQPGTVILGSYPDGSPAIVLNKYGKGQVITFAASPFTGTIFSSAPWWKFFRALQLDLGCAVDRDIWRFRFPRAAAPPPPQVPGDMNCLTGNSWYYECDVPVEGPNAAIPCAVSYENEPDLIPDNDRKDKLFNRKQAMNARIAANLKDDIRPWVVAWKRSDETAVKLEFARDVSVRKVRLWASGDIPEIEFGRLVSGTYRKLGSALAPVSEKGDVREIVIDVPPASGRDFILKFRKTTEEPFYLAELELWGDTEIQRTAQADSKP